MAFVLNWLEQGARRYTKSDGHSVDVHQAHIAFASFGPSDISAIKIAFLSKRLLRKPLLAAQLFDALSKSTFDLLLSLRQHAQVGLQDDYESTDYAYLFRGGYSMAEIAVMH